MSIWYQHPNSTISNKLLAETMAGKLGLKVTYFGDDFVVATMPVNAATISANGRFHGGAALTLAETLGTLGANACVDTSRLHCVCTEINANHVTRIDSGQVTAMARPVHQDSELQIWRVEIRGEEDELVCESRLTLSVVTRKAEG